MARKAKTIIHVNQHKIRANIKNDHQDVEPVLTVKNRKDNTYGYEAAIKDENGNVVAKVVYSPHKPLSCGARVWIETYNDVDIKTDLDDDE